MSNSAIIEALKAETLLQDSYLFQMITQLKDSLRYKSDGELISFDDFFLKLENRVDSLSKLKLQPTVVPGTENQYIIQLATALETILDEAEREEQKVIHYEAKLKDAASQIKKLGAVFCVWYTLAAAEKINQFNLELSATHLRTLGEAEYSRLMENLDQSVLSLVTAVQTTKQRLKIHTKTQQTKFELGKDQSNASWTNTIPGMGSTVSSERSDTLVEKSEVEDDVSEPDDVSVFDTPVLTYRKAANGGVETNQGVAVVKADRTTGLPKITLAQPVSLQTEIGLPGAPLMVATVPEDKYNALKEAVQEEPVSAEQFATLLSDEPVEKVAKPKKVKSTTTSMEFIIATGPLVERVKEDQPEKIKCAVCDRRIRIGQMMWQRDGNWVHADQLACEGQAKAVVEQQQAQLQAQIVADEFPQTKSFEEIESRLEPDTSVGEPGTLMEAMAQVGASVAPPITPSENTVNVTTALEEVEEAEEPTEVASDQTVAPLLPRKKIAFLEEEEVI